MKKERQPMKIVIIRPPAKEQIGLAIRDLIEERQKREAEKERECG